MSARSIFADKAVTLKKWNLALAIVHLASGIASIIAAVLLPVPLQARLYTDFDGVTLSTLAAYSLFITVVPIQIIASIIHWLQYADVAEYNKSVLCKGINSLRWIGFALANGLWTWSLFTLAGAGNIFLVISGVLVNFLMQYLGYLHERDNHPVNSPGTMIYLVLGIVPFVIIWAPVLTYHIINISTAKTYISVAIFGSLAFAFFMLVPFIWRYYQRKLNNTMTVRANFMLELFLIVLWALGTTFFVWCNIIGNYADP